MSIPEDLDLTSYDYDLPQERIAQFPAKNRGESRLMIIDRKGDTPPTHSYFSRLSEYLPEGSVLVANNSRVVPARLIGRRSTGGKVELLILDPHKALEARSSCVTVEVLLRPSGKLKPGEKLAFGNDISFLPEQKGDFGRWLGKLSWHGNLADSLEKAGQVPLPPYIQRSPDMSDSERYQTIYARQPGSVAAPTAGLHFNKDIMSRLAAKGIKWLELSLHVGYGTFSPVRCMDIRQHVMHEEYIDASRELASELASAKDEGRPIIAVGTTSLRALEGAYRACGKIAPFRGKTGIFLFPGSTFNVVDGLITNFHLPRSSLLMLVAAFTDRKRILSAYKTAINCGYNFFSYGDAMFIKPESGINK